MDWIYLSPHFDDVALSCGGLVWEQASAGERVEVWTICAGSPPPGSLSPFAEALHQRWETGLLAAGQRQEEDLRSVEILGAGCRRFSLPDCIYRRAPDGRFLYASEEALFGPVDPDEAGLVGRLAAELSALLKPGSARLVCPLALGHHVDHQLTRAAAEKTGTPLWYYADYPYVLKERARLEELQGQGWKSRRFPVSEAGLQAWISSIEAHTSQISTFWPDLEAMRSAMRTYWEENRGVRLWR